MIHASFEQQNKIVHLSPTQAHFIPEVFKPQGPGPGAWRAARSLLKGPSWSPGPLLTGLQTVLQRPGEPVVWSPSEHIP